jgi:hypothetical protein
LSRKEVEDKGNEGLDDRQPNDIDQGCKITLSMYLRWKEVEDNGKEGGCNYSKW